MGSQALSGAFGILDRKLAPGRVAQRRRGLVVTDGNSLPRADLVRQAAPRRPVGVWSLQAQPAESLHSGGGVGKLRLNPVDQDVERLDG